MECLGCHYWLGLRELGLEPIEAVKGERFDNINGNIFVTRDTSLLSPDWETEGLM